MLKMNPFQYCNKDEMLEDGFGGQCYCPPFQTATLENNVGKCEGLTGKRENITCATLGSKMYLNNGDIYSGFICGEIPGG